MTKVLIASANPWSFALAAERAIAATFPDGAVDALDLYQLSSRFSPHWRDIDRLAEAANLKYRRFILPAVSGRDITAEVARALPPIPIPPLPFTPAGLRDYRIGEARTGLATLSSVTSVTTVQDPVDLAEYGPSLYQAWRSAHLSERVGRIVAKMGYDTVALFNGRLCYARPFADVVEGHSTVLRFEQGGTGVRYIANATGVHAPSAVASLIAAHDFDAAEGKAFYEERLRKVDGNPVEFFTSAQVADRLPDGFEPERSATFYTSSSDEMFAVSDSPGYGHFANQYEVALALARTTAKRGERLAVRFHPHLQYKHASWRREWDFDALRALGAIIIEPGDAADTYALIRHSRCVVTCGSTVGFEAAYLGRPVAEAGQWAGGTIGAMAVILDEEDAARFIETPRIPPGARDQAIRYGSYAKRAGAPLSELDVGVHPYYARIAGRIVDPVRYLFQRLRAPFSRGSYVALPPGGKIIFEPSVAQAVAKDHN